VIGALLFLPAATLHWPGAWIFLVERAVLSAGIGLWLMRHNLPLLTQHLCLGARSEHPVTDEALDILIGVLHGAWLVLMAIGVTWFHGPSFPVWLQGLGADAIFLSAYIGYLTFRDSNYVTGMAKVQKMPMRSSMIAHTWPIRDAMVASVLLSCAGTPILLGSWWGLALAPIPAGALLLRVRMEEKALIEASVGWDHCADVVRCRLIPLVW
jgi:protein-S-isoprenylcysteine O-methyltransferase Ste14